MIAIRSHWLKIHLASRLSGRVAPLFEKNLVPWALFWIAPAGPKEIEDAQNMAMSMCLIVEIPFYTGSEDCSSASSRNSLKFKKSLIVNLLHTIFIGITFTLHNLSYFRPDFRF